VSRVAFHFYQCRQQPDGTRLKVEFPISEEQARRIYAAEDTSLVINEVVREVFALATDELHQQRNDAEAALIAAIAELARVRSLVEAAEDYKPKHAAWTAAREGDIDIDRLLRANRALGEAEERMQTAALALPPGETMHETCPVCEQRRELEEHTGVQAPGLCEECFKDWRVQQQEAPQL
jgi:hypothetical protein